MAAAPSPIPGIPSVENETTLGVELRSDTPLVRSIAVGHTAAVCLARVAVDGRGGQRQWLPN